MFRRKLSRLDPLGPSAADTMIRALPASGGAISLGADQAGAMRVLPVGQFAKNVAVTGSPGSGKTTLSASMASQLADSGVNVIILEPAKREYAGLLGAQVRSLYSYDDTDVNPFAVDPGVRVNTWIERLTMCMADAYAATQEESGRVYLEGLVRRLYRINGIDADAVATGRESWPTVQDFLQQVEPYMDQETCSGGEVSANIRGYLTSRGRAMAQCRAIRSAGPGLLARPLTAGGLSVVQLGEFGYGSGRFLAMVLLMRIVETARAGGPRPLHTVVITEEAHSLFINDLTGAPTMFSHLYTSALAELRSSGVGFVTVDQRASLLPSGCLANSVTKLCFSCSHGDDRAQVKAALGLSEEQAMRLSSLYVGQALFATQGSMGADVIVCGEGGRPCWG
jgi:energy-coupling factor transporter ATP-binding protein EcfA2